jgi:hypothetical protein
MSFTDDYDYEYEPEEIILHPTKGGFIINAFTGKETKYWVGSKDEGRFWKVNDVSLSSYDPTPEKFMGSAQGSKTFFFSSPEDYELVLEKTLDENQKLRWRQNRLKITKLD